MNMIIVGKDCEDCKFATFDKSNKVHCGQRDKSYYYGQCIPCEDKKKKMNNVQYNEQNNA